MAASAKSTVLIWNYHKVLELASISGPSQSRDMIDVTSHDSASGFREFIAGIIGAGEVSLDGNLIVGDANGQVAFHTDVQGGTQRNAFIVMPMSVGAALSFAALAKGFEASFPFDNKLGVSGSLQVTGKTTLLTTQSTGISALAGIEETDTTALSINEAIAAGTYEYTCTVDTASNWVKLTVTAVSHSLWIAGESETSGVQTGEIALGAAGTDTDILIIAQEAGESPRLYKLTVTRPVA